MAPATAYWASDLAAADRILSVYVFILGATTEGATPPAAKRGQQRVARAPSGRLPNERRRVAAKGAGTSGGVGKAAGANGGDPVCPARAAQSESAPRSSEPRGGPATDALGAQGRDELGALQEAVIRLGASDTTSAEAGEWAHNAHSGGQYGTHSGGK